LNFGLWLKFSKGNRESSISRKLRFFAKLSGTPSDMTNQVLSSSWCDKSKSNCLDAIAQFAEFKNIPYSRPNFRAYNNEEMFVPNPEMVKQFVYRIRSIPVKSMIMLSVETGCSSGEAWMLLYRMLHPREKLSNWLRVLGEQTIKQSGLFDKVSPYTENSTQAELAQVLIHRYGVAISEGQGKLGIVTRNDFMKLII